jgi:uncharacterized protein YbaR (Trm112 family)
MSHLEDGTLTEDGVGMLSDNNGDDAPLEDNNDNQNEILRCRHCGQQYRQPRILQCLHVFCTDCLEKIAVTPGPESAGIRDDSSGMTVLACPVCQQETRTWAVEKLPIDLIMMNLMDVADIRERRMICTSCKAQEKAVARCSDCASFLCPSCVTAHKFMRCFENHKVHNFDDLLKCEHIDIHKPFFCSLHQNESVKYFCNSCQVPVCSECMLSNHKAPGHQCERIAEIEGQQLDELRSVVAETRAKISSCDAATADLESMLSDLQQQRDFARDLITETCHSYKAILDKCQENLLGELEEIHKSNELAIMEMSNTTEKTSERIDDGCRFTERVLAHGNGVEILSLKKFVTMQLLTLLNNMPRLEAPRKIEFSTDYGQFEAVAKAAFGHFKKQEVKPPVHGSVLQSSFEGEKFLNPSLASVTAGCLDSISPDIVSSLTSLGLHHTGPGIVGGQFGGTFGAPGVTSSVAGAMPHVAAGQFPERSMSRNSYSPAMSDSGISVDAASNGSLAAMSAFSKLRGAQQVSVNAQGQITVNGQAITSLAHQSAPGLTSRTLSMPPSSDTSLASLLESLTTTTSLPATSPPLSDLSGILGVSAAQQLLNIGASVSGGQGRSVHGVSDDGASSVVASLLGGQVHSNLPSFGLGNDNPTPLRSRLASAKSNPMQIRCKFGQLGSSKGQFNSPHGFCLGMDEDIVVADTNNHRIQIFDKTGEFKSQFGNAGRDEGQLWYPRKVAVIRSSGKYVVCDRGSERSRMQLFTKTGQFIRKIGIRYIDIVAGLAISSQGHIVAVDSVSPTLFCIGENGDLVHWFDCSDYMREPSDIAISGSEYYVCDFKGHCVVVFSEDGKFLHRIGCENITNYPNGIDISDAGDILVGDSHGNRFHIAVFQRDGSLIGEFECPYVKVSRCCGLKITQEGYVVTLAKNNQHVLVLNTLYIA